MSSLTLGDIKAAMERLPPRMPMPEAVIMPQRMLNQQLNMVLEIISCPVYRTAWLPRMIFQRLILRSQYKTRAGFRHARLYWRRWDKKQRAAEENTIYLLRGTK